MKRLWIAEDVPQYQGDCSDYCYVVKAETEKEAVGIVKRNIKHCQDWKARLADNTEVWE